MNDAQIPFLDLVETQEIRRVRYNLSGGTPFAKASINEVRQAQLNRRRDTDTWYIQPRKQPRGASTKSPRNKVRSKTNQQNIMGHASQSSIESWSLRWVKRSNIQDEVMVRRYGWRALLKALNIQDTHKESEIEIKILPVTTLRKVKQVKYVEISEP